ncbi:hypothetical protein ACVWY2_007646 [Bradyrhizobium sp. JR6.1]
MAVICSRSRSDSSPRKYIPESEHTFFLKTTTAQITFAVEPDGIANALTLHQGGSTHNATRIGDRQAQDAAAALAKKIDNKTPSPGTEEAIRRLIIQHQQGAVDYAGMSDVMAAVAREQAPAIIAALDLAGGMQTIRFKGVGRDGWDVYDVNFANVDMEWRIILASDGKIDGVLLRSLP